MFAFLILVSLTVLLVRYVKWSITISFRKYYVYFSTAIIFLGIFAVIVYTIDNLYHGQVDMPGDAQWYYEGALTYLLTGETQTYYPNYEKFIASFLFFGGPILARLAQLMVFLCMYTLSIKALDWLRVSLNGFIYFSTFVALSGIYYGAFMAFTRDFLILFTYAFVFFVLIWYYNLTEVHRKAPNARLLCLIILSALWLDSLGHWLIYPLILGALGELLLAFLKKNVNWKMTLVGFAVVAIFLASGGFSEIQRLYQVIVVEGVLFEAEAARLGVERTRSLLDIFAVLFGPGLIRPLFPNEFFLVWIPSHVAFYWWGTLFWYVNLIISVPFLFRKPLALMGKRGAIFIILVFLFLVAAYTLAFGSGMGMRKRMMFHFLYTLFIAATYYTPLGVQSSTYEQKRVFTIPSSLVRLGVVLMLIVATIMSVD